MKLLLAGLAAGIALILGGSAVAQSLGVAGDLIVSDGKVLSLSTTPTSQGGWVEITNDSDQTQTLSDVSSDWAQEIKILKVVVTATGGDAFPVDESPLPARATTRVHLALIGYARPNGTRAATPMVLSFGNGQTVAVLVPTDWDTIYIQAP